jgi:hypothetical protein
LDELIPQLREIVTRYREDGVYSSLAVIETENYRTGLMSSIQTLGGSFFRPNVLFLHTDGNPKRDEELVYVINRAREYRLGVILLCEHPEAHLARRRTINLWVRDQSPEWRLSMNIGNLDLAILTAYKFILNWQAKLNLITAVNDRNQVENAHRYLTRLIDLARIPYNSVIVENKEFETQLSESPQADLSIFGLPNHLEIDFVYKLMQATHSTCLFVRDSGEENALA